MSHLSAIRSAMQELLSDPAPEDKLAARIGRQAAKRILKGRGFQAAKSRSS